MTFLTEKGGGGMLAIKKKNKIFTNLFLFIICIQNNIQSDQLVAEESLFKY